MPPFQLEIGIPVAVLMALGLTALTCIVFPQRVNDLLDTLLERIASTEKSAA